MRGTVSDDLYEGIRAILVDKDNAPKWNPASLQEVTLEKLTQVFQPFEESHELQLPSRTPSFWWIGNSLQTHNNSGQAIQSRI
jgi:3-hydroxyisobutyryl-CoA hydrolase